jgi:hypothetical protein
MRPNETHANLGFAIDDHTLALLAERKIPYEMYVQGQEFDIGANAQTKIWMLVLAGGGSVLLSWAIRRKRWLAVETPLA